MDEVPLGRPLLVSACLLGIPTAYDGQGHPDTILIYLAARGLAVPICPEVAGGLPIPRPPAEICGGDGNAVLDGRATVYTADGIEVTTAYLIGARRALQRARQLDVRYAVLKSHSPSCGCGLIYDGTFSKHLTRGDGVTAALLRRAGIAVYDEMEWERNYGESAFTLR